MLQMEISTEPINSQIMRTSPPRATPQTTIVLVLDVNNQLNYQSKPEINPITHSSAADCKDSSNDDGGR